VSCTVGAEVPCVQGTVPSGSSVGLSASMGLGSVGPEARRIPRHVGSGPEMGWVPAAQSPGSVGSHPRVPPRPGHGGRQGRWVTAAWRGCERWGRAARSRF